MTRPGSRGDRLGFYGDALRNMTARQLLHRPRRRLPPRFLAAGTREHDPTAWRPLAAGLAIDPAPQSGAVPSPESTGIFEAAGHRRPFLDAPGFWQPGEEGLLFAFHLQGFSELARYAATGRSVEGDAFWCAVIASWLQHEREPRLPAWHPYPMSGRIAAWCSALSTGDWLAALRQPMLRSLTRQAAVIGRSIEHDIGGNHVLRNATGLVCAGVCLGEARHERRGMGLLRDELARQILADGGHEERSPSYHRAVLSDLTDVERLLERASQSVPAWLTSARERMQAWQQAMRGPDGLLPLLNDAWEGPPEPAERVNAPMTALESSGYIVLRHDHDQAILDVGPVAPAHLPPHSHADVLSFVLWADGRPLIVDPGSFTYSGPERQRFRSTASHNTLEVDRHDQCELWGDFRAAFMPRIERLDIEAHGDATVVVCRHDGYRRLADPVAHQRTFCWLPQDGLVIIDALDAQRRHHVRARLHLAPGIPLREDHVGPLRLSLLGSGPGARAEPGEHSPYLGAATPIEVIERALDVDPRVPFGWALLRPGARAVLDAHCLSIERRDGRTLALDVGGYS